MRVAPTPKSRLLFAVLIVVGMAAAPSSAEEKWVPLFDGKDLDAWTVRSPGAAEIWQVKDGIIDCAPVFQPGVDQNLWSKRSFGDFTLHVEWRIKDLKTEGPIPTILPDGTYLLDDEGERVLTSRAIADSGIYVRGSSKHQINIWNWPIGSGEVYGYRNNQADPVVRAAVTPSVNADKPIGEWNTFRITMQGKKLTVVLNGQKVIDQAVLAEAAEFAPIALQHHGGYDAETDTWKPSSSLVQFRNIKVREL